MLWLRSHGLEVTESHLGPQIQSGHHPSTLKGIMARFGAGDFPLGLRQFLLSLSSLLGRISLPHFQPL